jgi:YidC/Oxa1 family membrane protein insertase
MWNTIIIDPAVNALLWIYSVLGQNFGLAIIAFTILIRLITYPLTAQQMKSSQAMQNLQKSKEWQEIQKKYKDDREKLAQEQMKHYREMGVSPFGSCLPTLIQFPIIIGLYQAVIRALAVTPTQLLELSSHVYPFFNAAALIPLNNYFLWMDLSQPETAYGIKIAGFGLPILAILVVVSTFLQSKLMTPPSTGDQAAGMTRAMNLYMPLFMGYLAYSFPSGLAIYFVTSNVVGILQYALMGKISWRNLLPQRVLAGPGAALPPPAAAKKSSPGENKPAPAKSTSPKKKTSTKRT